MFEMRKTVRNRSRHFWAAVIIVCMANFAGQSSGQDALDNDKGKREPVVNSASNNIFSFVHKDDYDRL